MIETTYRISYGCLSVIYANRTSICSVCFSLVKKIVLPNYKVSIAEINVKAYLLEA